MKITITMHVPVEQYGYIEHEMEGTEEEIAEQYTKIKDAFKALTPEEPEVVQDTPFSEEGSPQKCPKCGTPMVKRPAGVAKSGKSYSAFWGCPNWKKH